MFGHKQILQFRDVDLNEVIRSVSSSLRQLAGEHIIVETDCDSGLPPIHADRGMVEQVIVNLTQNAREAMPGGGRLVIQSGVAMVKEPGAGVGREGRPGEFVRLTVSAIGGGVDAAAAARPFEPNFSNTDASKRTVLGLATAYGIIKQHRGWIDVQAPGTQGANFQVYFPVSEPASPRSSEVGAQPPERLTKSALISPA
jgi:signal transduction histidine kinase